MAEDEFVYTGTDNLEVMADAVNYNRFLIDAVVEHVPGGARVLDFGAGTGTYADMLLEREIRADVLEPDGAQQATLRDKGYTVVSGDEIRSGASTYDVVYTLNVLEHIKNDQEAVDELATLLSSGGRLVVYVPAFEALFTSMDVKVEHYRRYRRRQLERILRNAGLDVITSRYCDPLGFFATLVYKWFGSESGDLNPRTIRLYDRVFFPISRALQVITGRFFGKNVLVVATKP